MSFFSATTKKPLPVTTGTDQIVSEGVRALEALPAFLASLGEDAAVSELQIWENTAIMASIYHDYANDSYGWNGEQWVAVSF